MKKCKHQFFEIKKISKTSKYISEHNAKERARFFKALEDSGGLEMAPWIFTLPADIFGVRVKCALCNKQKDIFEEQLCPKVKNK